MRIKETKVYPFDELSDESREVAIQRLWDINVYYDWWQFTFEDAEQAGLKLTEFELDSGSYCYGEFIVDAANTVNLIVKNHGEDCETAGTAREYVTDLAKLYVKYPVKLDDDGFDDNEWERDQEQEEMDGEFLKSILEDYRIILQKEYEYQTSREVIIETIKANEFEFTDDGNLA